MLDINPLFDGVLAWTAITIYHRLGSLKHQNLFIHSSRGWNLISQCHIVRFWQEFSLWLTNGYLLAVCSHGLSSVHAYGVRREREREIILPFLIKPPIFMTSCNHNYLSKALYINAITLRDRDSTYEFGDGGEQFIPRQIVLTMYCLRVCIFCWIFGFKIWFCHLLALENFSKFCCDYSPYHMGFLWS